MQLAQTGIAVEAHTGHAVTRLSVSAHQYQLPELCRGLVSGARFADTVKLPDAVVYSASGMRVLDACAAGSEPDKVVA